jgi:urea carboxylase-associated protein 2
MTPDDYRRRYSELKEQAKTIQRPSARHLESPAVVAGTLAREIIPPGWYWTRRLLRGQVLRLTNTQATHGVSLLLWNAYDTSERYNAGDTVKVQWTARIGQGRLLLSDMGRVLASVIGDTCGFHDAVAGGSTRTLDDAKYGPDPVRRNTAENFLLAAGKHGMDARDLGPCITFFAPVVTDDAGNFHWQGEALAPGHHVDLRLEMDVVVAVSNCPHPLSPRRDWTSEPVEVQVWQAPPPGDDDFCSTATEEAVRAFENTRSYLREMA